MDITNLDVAQTRDNLQTFVKSETTVTFQNVTICKMNFKPLFSIEENDVATRVYIPKDQNEFKIFAEQILVDGQPLELIYSENPVLPHHGTCPVCNGTKQVNSLPCNNCGGQYNDNNPRGTVLLNQNNTPCTHDYNSQVIRNNYTQFFCDSCGDVYFKNI